ncbi:hypothetical protein M405DRAFT_734626 [Rhizopogon salebrosus TDB-379]|nr:hypothetical protein M405DRAFT_734626 [Rhizopogon salebrosus TDB-379]
MRDQTVILNQGVSSWACRIPVSLSGVVWVRICLHREDALNRLNPSYFRKTGRQPYPYRDPDPRQEAQKARQLSKYIFPLQYSLSNVFSHASPAKESYKQPDFTDREREIEVRECIASYGGLLGKCKTPKRLRDVLVLLEKMIWRHGKCGYLPLRNKVCPSKVSQLFNYNAHWVQVHS